LAFGALDYAADVGAQPVPEAVAYAESRIVNASAAAQLARPLACPTTQLDDTGLLTQEAARARAMGFGGKLCLHPKQIAPVASAFAPTRRELDWAKRVIAESAGGAVRVEGEMIDAPQILRARNILEEASTL
jgi:citrate lyase subunit beta/citryl-CoA lyase